MLPRMSYTIRTMSRAEVELALDWAAAEGWNPGLGDATPFQVADPAGFLVGEVDDEPAAVISVVRYGDEFGFLGFYIVAPEHRGRGHGLRLWQAGLAHLEGRTVGLDGVVAQQANYRRSGFAYAWPNYRFGGPVESRADPRLVDARTLPFGAIERLDRSLFPAPRPAFLAAWLAMPEGRTLALVEDGEVAGLGTVRRCRSGHKIGPLYAADQAAAERIMRGLAACAGGEELFLDVPGLNDAAMRLAQELGLTQRFETARMYKGEAPTLPLERVFGITTFELG
jgi:Acetyltransferase (GNAT) domain/Acetyltransferase (GNAT) family